MYVYMYVIVVIQARVRCLICTHDARGRAAPEGECGHIRQRTSSCVATNMLHFHGLTVFIQTLVTFDYGFQIIVLQTLAMHFFYTDTCTIVLWV